MSEEIEKTEVKPKRTRKKKVVVKKYAFSRPCSFVLDGQLLKQEFEIDEKKLSEDALKRFNHAIKTGLIYVVAG